MPQHRGAPAASGRAVPSPHGRAAGGGRHRGRRPARRAAARRPLPARPGAGPRWDVDGLPRHGHPARPARRGEGDGPAAGRRPGVPGPVRARGPLGGPDRPSGRRRTCTTRAPACSATASRSCSSSWSSSRAARCATSCAPRGALPVAGGGGRARPGARRPGAGAPARARAPRRQAGERADQPHRRGEGRPTSGWSPPRRRPGRATPGMILGTVAYLSPEQVTTGAADARSDVYAAGVLAYELLTGAPPFTGDTAISVAYRHVHDEVPAPSSAAPGVPPELDDLIVRATRRDPAARPADAGAFLAALCRVVERAGIAPRAAARASRAPGTRRPPPAPRPRRPSGSPASPARAGRARCPATTRRGGPSRATRPRRRRTRSGSAGAAAGCSGPGSRSSRCSACSSAPPAGGWAPGAGPRCRRSSASSGRPPSGCCSPRTSSRPSPSPAHDDVAAGMVSAVDPAPGARLLRGSTVRLTVSSGRPQVPAVAAGTPVADAEQAIRDAGLTPARSGSAREYSATAPAGSGRPHGPGRGHGPARRRPRDARAQPGRRAAPPGPGAVPGRPHGRGGDRRAGRRSACRPRSRTASRSAAGRRTRRRSSARATAPAAWSTAARRSPCAPSVPPRTGGQPRSISATRNASSRLCWVFSRGSQAVS